MLIQIFEHLSDYETGYAFPHEDSPRIHTVNSFYRCWVCIWWQNNQPGDFKPSCSPDLNLCDFYVWGIFERWSVRRYFCQ